MNDFFLALYGHTYSKSDFFSHLVAPNDSSMHIVLDLNCKARPTISDSEIQYEVFRVKKRGDLDVRIVRLR